MLSRGLRWVLSIQILAALACFATELYCRFSLHRTGQYIWPLLQDNTFLQDFTLLIDRFAKFHSKAFYTVAGFPFMYPPGAGLIYAAFYPIGSGASRSWVFASALLVLFFVAISLFTRAVLRRGATPLQGLLVFVLTVNTAYPFWFCFQRGNIELFLWAISALGCWALYRQRDSPAAVCFALAGSMKLYPAIYLGLFLSQRNWRRLGLGLLCFGLFSLAALWLLCPHIVFAARQTAVGLHIFNVAYAGVNRLALGFDHSLFGLYKFAVRNHPAHLYRASVEYTIGAAGVGCTLYLVRIRKLALHYQVVALTCALLVLPPVSFDYTLLHVYTALGFLLLSTWGRETRADLCILTLLALVASPLTELIWEGYTLQGQAKALLLLAALLLTMVASSRVRGDAPLVASDLRVQRPWPLQTPS